MDKINELFSFRQTKIRGSLSVVDRNPGERRKPKQKLRLVQRRLMTLKKRAEGTLLEMSEVGVAKSL